jgi:hypothetical protein
MRDEQTVLVATMRRLARAPRPSASRGIELGAQKGVCWSMGRDGLSTE